MVIRERYLKQLRELRDINIIKVVTGVRRCGKSTLLNMFKDELSNNGVAKKCIQQYNLEDPNNSNFEDWKVFYNHIKDNLVANKMNYIFLDEIQMLDNFERLLDGLHLLTNVDLYVTGSNAYLLSGELATILIGRAITINMYPFSFAEYLDFLQINKPVETNFTDYLQTGGFPQALQLQNISYSLYNNYLKGLLETIIEKDIKTRNKIYNEKTFDNVIRFLADSVGSLVSANNVTKTLKNDKKEVDDKTVSRYISILNDSFLFYHIDRFDIKGKKILKTNGKQYIVDTGFRNMLLGRENLSDIGHLLENVIYFELLRRGHSVWTGKNNDREVDFISKDEQGYIHYFQVCASLRDASTRERELSAFNAIKDHNPKTIITLDPEEPTYNGIICKNVINWLLS
jgi:predicted AAA+ superfamily ATPase